MTNVWIDKQGRVNLISDDMTWAEPERIEEIEQYIVELLKEAE